MLRIMARGFPLFAWGVLGYSLLVILWGYFLRISESGDGCGTDWPLCHGAVMPTGAAFPTWVELIHRISSGLVLLLVLAMVVWAFRAYGQGHAVRKAAGAALLLTVSESLIGAFLVVFGLVATDVSTARILIRPLHVTNTFLLMAALGLTAWWAQRGVDRTPSLRALELRPVWPGVLGILALAWTGSWTGLAGTAFPTASVAEGIGQYLAPDHLLIYLRVTHPAVAVVVTVLLARLAWRSWREPSAPAVRPLAAGIAALAGLQLLAGPLTILLLHPPGLRLFHLLLADLLWLAVIFLGAAATSGAHSQKENSNSRFSIVPARDPLAAMPSAFRKSPEGS